MLRDYNHNTVEAPYLALVEDRRHGPSLWHLRVLQPNVERMPAAAAHSLEHVLIHRMRAADKRFVIAGLMGCGTGYYLAAAGLTDFQTMGDLLADALTWGTETEAVPLADDIHCGMAADHDLDGMRKLATYLLDMRDEWGSPGPNAQLISPDAT